MLNSSIPLNPEEQTLFRFLVEKRDEAGLVHIEMRVAGGWVRDKLIGGQSKDIDITLSGMTGREFLSHLGLDSQIVEANPEKSKHLETAKARILGMEVDFVNLRSETYTDSRVPIIQMGTPEQDARRRDLTINALFYNIGTQDVEDHVGGLPDLATMLLKTPAEPLQTFLDDPLRMLRLLRFHSRFPGSTIAPEVEEALYNRNAIEAFRSKVSQERSGPELMGLFAGLAPAPAVKLFLDTGLYQSVFNQPLMRETLGIRMDQKNQHHSLSLLDHTVEVVRNVNQIMLDRAATKEMRTLMNAAAMFHDLGKMHPRGRQPHPTRPEQMQYIGHEDVSAELSEESLRAIGVGSDERQVINRVVEMHMRPHRFESAEEWSPKAMGKFIRDSIIAGQEFRSDLWEYIFEHSIADAMSKGNDSWTDDVAAKRQSMERFRNYITSRNEGPARISKPLLNGKEIMALVPELPASSGFIKEVSAMLLELQDAQEISTPEQATKAVLRWRAARLSLSN